MEIFDQLLRKLEETGLADKSGAVLYSSIRTLSPGPLYLLGYNPGGGPEDEPQTVRGHLRWVQGKANWNEYICGEWKPGKRQLGPGEAPMQKRVRALLKGVGLETEDVCASNLIFIRSRDDGKLSQPAELANKCWPVHEFILSKVRPKAILTIGRKAFDSVLARGAATAAHEQFPAGERDGWCRAGLVRLADRDVNLVSIPHLGQRIAYDLTQHAKALNWVKGKLELN